jgi:hypothetical protein
MKYPYGTTIFCDDIRDEVGGKKTYVGSYRGDYIIFGDFPLIVPLFCLSVSYFEPIKEDLHPTSIKVFVPGDSSESETILDFDLPMNRRERIQENISDPFAEYFASIIDFKISPFLIKKEGHVKVRAYRSDIEYRLGTIYIRKPKPDEKIPGMPPQ